VSGPADAAAGGPPLSRRDAVRAGVLAGAALAAGAACGPDRAPRPAPAGAAPDAPPPAPGRALDADDQALAEAIADTLLPDTAASPGARAAGAGPAMNLLLTDCYEADAQRRVVAGLAEFRALCQRRRGRDFAALPGAEREALLREIDAEAARAGDAHYFGLVRELALRAYFSSEVGMTRALRYVRVPGRWDGCVPLAPGQPAWG
jgi:hypothetical protein